MPRMPATSAFTALTPSAKSKNPPMKLNTNSSTRPESMFSSSLKKNFTGRRMILMSSQSSRPQTMTVMIVARDGMILPPLQVKRF